MQIIESKKKKSVCDHCGYTADGRFEENICPNCGLDKHVWGYGTNHAFWLNI